MAQILVAENTVLFRVRSIYFALDWDFQSNQLVSVCVDKDEGIERKKREFASHS